MPPQGGILVIVVDFTFVLYSDVVDNLTTH